MKHSISAMHRISVIQSARSAASFSPVRRYRNAEGHHARSFKSTAPFKARHNCRSAANALRHDLFTEAAYKENAS
jgi:hypothetical protein